jgi:hypothetical protein
LRRDRLIPAFGRPIDADGINVNATWELAYWTKELGVSREDLARVVKEVGPSVSAVREALERSK